MIASIVERRIASQNRINSIDGFVQIGAGWGFGAKSMIEPLNDEFEERSYAWAEVLNHYAGEFRKPCWYVGVLHAVVGLEQLIDGVLRQLS